MSRKIEEFKPLVPGHVGLYSCGPTVYHYAHIGNLRTYISTDVLKRMFIENGFTVKQVMNITDVGHLTSDEDYGDDKMEKGAAREGKTVWEIAQMYTDAFISDLKDLNIIMPDEMPRATDYISGQIEMVQALGKLGYTYEIPSDGIYYDTSKFPDYGALGGQNLDELKAGARIGENAGKRNPTDFALWKFSPKDGAKRAMEWDSPWGVGFPGWAIECSVMSRDTLGAHFDIHSGGIDHVKVHHTNEIAQSEPLYGKPWVSYWIHFEFLNDKTGKMSKSNGEFLTLQLLKDRGYDPMAYRYLTLLGHYKSQIEFSWEALDAAANGYKSLVRKVADILRSNHEPRTTNHDFIAWHDKILDAVSDNLKTATAIVHIQELIADTKVDPTTKIAVLEFADRLLGLNLIGRAKELLKTENTPVPKEIQKLSDERIAAKNTKNWALADQLRDQIEASGYTISDNKDGVKIIRK
jgi:cysteinyl-tRNA synthetase